MTSHCECRCDAFTRYAPAPRLHAILTTLIAELRSPASHHDLAVYDAADRAEHQLQEIPHDL